METASRSKTIRIGGGTPVYTAPEVYHGKPTSPKSDVYAFGVLCHEVISGRKAYGGEGTNQYAIMKKKFDGEPPCLLQDKDCPPAAQELVRRCCATDPTARPTMEQVKNSLLQLPDEWMFGEHAASKKQTGNTKSRAATTEDVDTLTAQLDKGANIGGNQEEDEAQLRQAAENGWIGVVQKLLKSGVSVDSRDKNGATPLYIAAEFGDAAVAEVLIDAGAKVDSRKVDGTTPLFIAAQNGETEVTKCLLKRGAKADSSNEVW
eukprot:evm.model.scf_861.3 EVM.evm.TU.scf_861.3   scf_861:44209-49391(-)